MKWCELDSSLNKTSGGRQGTLEAVLSLELFWKFCFFKWVQCLLLYCAKLELTLMQKKKKKIHTETGLKQTAFSFSANSLSRTCTIYYILYRATQQLVRHIDYLAIFCTGPIWIGPLPQSLSYSNKQQSLHSARVQLLISQWITVHQSRTPLSFFPLSLVSLSFKMSDCETMKFHCLCIYSLWSRDYWLYKVIQTDEWILYWLKCKYRLTLGSSHTARHTAAVFIVLHCQPEEQKCFP